MAVPVNLLTQDDIETLEIPLIVMQLQPVINLTDDQFYELCQLNRDLRIEQTSLGELIVMPPAGGESGKRNADLTIDLAIAPDQRKKFVPLCPDFLVELRSETDSLVAL